MVLNWLKAIMIAVAVLVGFTPDAHAQQTYPRRYVNRPLWLPHGGVRVDGAFPLHSVDAPGQDRLNTFSALIGIGVGIIPNLEIGAVALPLQLAEEFDYRNPSFYASYRWVSTKLLDLGLRADVSIPFQDARESFDGAVIPFSPWFGDVAVGIPLRLRFVDAVRLDIGAHLGFVFTDPLGTRITLPVKLAFQLTDTVFIGPQSGVQIINGDEATVPAGLFVGTNLGAFSERPTCDLVGTFLLPDTNKGFDEFVVGVALNLYLFL